MEDIQFKKDLFGGDILILVYNTDRKIAEDILSETYEEALRLQRIFNFYDKGSELSKLNQKRRLKVSEDLLKIIKKALEISNLTDSKYDITLGKQILQRKNGEEITPLNCSHKDISINGNEIILNHPDVLIDLGSIAKGYITDRIAEFLGEKGIEEFFIDSRGDIFVSGENPKIIGIQHPRDKDNLLGSIKIVNNAVATSGDYNQYSGSFDKSHILNQNNAVSITVVAPTLQEADVYATALFVCNENEREKLIKDNKGIKVLIVKDDLTKITYNGFDEVLYER